MSTRRPVSRSGRFESGPGADVACFTESISFDWRLWEHDIRGSIAHARNGRWRGLVEQQAIFHKKRRWQSGNR